MFGNNAFGALGMDQAGPSNSSAGPSLRQVEGEEVEVEWLQLSKTNGEVYVRVQDPVDLQDLPSECNLMAISNTWGLVIVGGPSDVRIHRLGDIHKLFEDSPKDALPTSTPISTLPLPARPVWIRLGMNEERLIVATLGGAGVHVYKLRDVLSGNTNPYHTFSSDLPSHLLDLIPNPAPTSPYATLLAPEGLVIADIEARKLSSPLAGPFTCASWSAKGKQIVVGTPSGKLAQYTPEGTLKAEIPAPPELDEPHYPTCVQWLENDLFIVYYARQDSEPEDPLECFVIHRSKQSISYTKFFDIMDSFGVPGRSSRYRHFAGLRAWGQNTKHLAFFVSGLATEVVVMHGAADGASSRWELLTLGETARAVLPAAKKGVSEDDTSVLALDIDLTVDKPVQRGMVGGVDLPDLPPPPRLIAYSQAGFLVSFNIQYSDVEAYPGKVTPKDLLSSTESDAMDLGTGANTPAPPETSKPTFGGFGTSTSSGFGSTTPSKSPAASSAFGQTTKPAFGSSAFGQASFGSTTPTTTPSKPAFGQAGFGSSTTPTSKPAGFGQTSAPSQPAFGASGFGQTSKPAFGSSGFGQTSSSSAFGQSPFGQANKTPAPAFGSASFGQPSKPSTTASGFGQSTFGQPAKPGAPGSAFGQSGFGQTAKADSAAPSSSAFGQPAKPAPTSFGAGASPSTSTAFGGFGSKTGTSPAFGFGSSAFGQSAKPADTKSETSAAATPNLFGNSAFGSTFGASSGQSAFGAKPSSIAESPSAFGGFGQKQDASSPFADSGATKAASPDAASSSGKDDFGLGGFASALSDSNKPAPVPGLADSPPGSPVLQGGKAGQVPGLEESPPASPVLKPKPVQPSQTSAASSFIKPATGFSGASTGVFGSFGGTKSTSAFGSTSPAAFSAPAPKTSAFAPASPASGGSAFGQTSKPGAPAFGSSTFGQTTKPATTTGSAFGQSSKPLGFGQTPTPTPSFGAISGGFGGFARTAAPTADGKPAASGGFAGFGAKTSGQGGFGAFAGKSEGSIFGEKSAPALPAPAPIFGKKEEPPVIASKSEAEAKVEEPVAKPERPATPPGYDVPEPPKAPLSPLEQTPEGKSASGEAVKEEVGSDTAGSDETKKNATAEPVTEEPGASAQKEASREEESRVEEAQEERATDESQTQEGPAATVSLADLADAASAAAVPLPPADSPGQEKAELESPDSDEPVLVEHGDASPAAASDQNAEEAEPSSNVDDEQYGNDEYDYDDESEQYEEDQTHRTGVEDEASEGGDEEDASEGSEDNVETEEESEGEDEGEEEDEDDEADQDQSRYSVGPEMSPIDESAELEEDADVDEGQVQEPVEQTKTTPKSPPAWFAKPSPMTLPVPSSPSPAQSPAGESPLARSGASKESSTPPPPTGSQPIAVGQKLPASFNLKHTVRTSSPLGQPPQMATSSPDASPAKPTSAPAFGVFGQAQDTKSGSSLFGSGSKFGSTSGLGLGKPPGQDAASTAQTGPPSLFAGFGQAAKPAEPSTAPGADTAKASSATSASAAPPSIFGSVSQAKPATEQPIQNGGSLFGNLGESKPSTAGTTQPGSLSGGLKQSTAPTGSVSQPSSLFSGFAQTTPQDQAKPPASSLFAGLDQQPQQAGTAKPPQPPVSTSSGFSVPAAPAQQQAPSQSVPAAVAKKTFTAPSRPPLPAAQLPKEDGRRTMSAVLERMIQALLADMELLKETMSANAKFHAQFTDAAFSSVPLERIHEHKELPFSSLKQITSIIQDLSARLSDLRSVENGIEAKISDIQSSLLKTDMKVGQADKFLQAKSDGVFARAMQVKDLSPEQAEHQARLRKLIQSVESTLVELEEGVAGLKKGLDRREPGQGSAGDSPSLGRIHKGVRKVDAGIADRAATIDDLATRIASLRVATPGKRRDPAPSAAPEKKPSKSIIPLSLEPSSAVIEAIEKGTDRRAALKARLSARSGTTAKVTKQDPAELPTGASSHGSLVSGPIRIDDIPVPGLQAFQVEGVSAKEVKSAGVFNGQLAQAAKTTTTPSFSFSNPGAASPSPAPAAGANFFSFKGFGSK